MTQFGYPVLTSLIVFPVVASIALAALRDPRVTRMGAMVAACVEVLLAIPLLAGFDAAAPGYQFREYVSWVPQWGLAYSLGIDGISLIMILLTVGLLPLTVLCSWQYISQRVTAFHVCLLLMAAACIGVFAALDFVLFYVFWEAMLVPMYLLIAVWGGPDRRYASIKFFLYTLAGSTLLLVAMVAFYKAGGTFSIPELSAQTYSFRFQFWVFLAMSLAFAIKVPMFPFHTWLPAAHVEAPAAGSVVLAAVLLKMGTYGFLRFCLPMAPQASTYFAPYMIALALASILYGGYVALGQSDIKKLIAYSSVGHMGFAMLGIFLLNMHGLEGALLVMLNHGITTGALFMMIGFIYERSHSREMADNQGLGKYLPAYMGFWGLFALSSLGFPGLNSFVGEAATLFGAFEYSTLIGMLAIPGAMLAAAYMLRLSLRMAWGQPSSVPGAVDDHHGHDGHEAHEAPHGAHGHPWSDLGSREWTCLVPLAFLALWLGIFPAIAFKVIDPPLERLLTEFRARQAAPAAMAQSDGRAAQ